MFLAIMTALDLALYGSGFRCLIRCRQQTAADRKSGLLDAGILLASATAAAVIFRLLDPQFTKVLGISAGAVLMILVIVLKIRQDQGKLRRYSDRCQDTEH